MIFVDSNIPMYLVSVDHPHKQGAQRMLRDAVLAGERLVTDAEVFQEILHRYTAIHRKEAITPAFAALLGVVDEVFAVKLEDVQRAREIILAGAQQISARDALHIAVMQREQVTTIMSFDTGFDAVSGVERLPAP